MVGTSPSHDLTAGAIAVLDRLTSDAGHQHVIHCLRSCALPSTPALVDDVIVEAALRIIGDIADGSVTPDDLDQSMMCAVRAVVDGLSGPAHMGRSTTPTGNDERSGIRSGDGPPRRHPLVFIDEATARRIRRRVDDPGSVPWITAAVLAYLTFLERPDSIPVDAPVPGPDVDPDQGLVWSALWATGQWALFPDPCPESVARRRARHAQDLLDRIDELVVRDWLATRYGVGVDGGRP